MFTGRREEWADTRVIALVELDLRKMRVRIVLGRKAIGERMLELEHSSDHHGEPRTSSARRIAADSNV